MYSPVVLLVTILTISVIQANADLAVSENASLDTAYIGTTTVVRLPSLDIGLPVCSKDRQDVIQSAIKLKEERIKELQAKFDELLQLSIRVTGIIKDVCDKADIALKEYLNSKDLKERKKLLEIYIKILTEKKNLLKRLLLLKQELNKIGTEKVECECKLTELKLDIAKVVLRCICIVIDIKTPTPSPSRKPCPCRCYTGKKVKRSNRACKKLNGICILKKCRNTKGVEGIECCDRE